MINIQDTAFPVIRVGSSVKRLEKAFSPDEEDLLFAVKHVKGQAMQACFLVLLKATQRLARFVPVSDIPDQVIRIITCKTGLKKPPVELMTYDRSGSKAVHIRLIRKHLKISAFGKEAKKIAENAATEASRIKSEGADVLNVILEKLIKNRIELPAFSTLSDMALSAISKTNNGYFDLVFNALSESSCKKLDSLLISGKDSRTDWDLIRKDAGALTVGNIRTMSLRLKWLRKFPALSEVIKNIPERKVHRLCEEALSMDAGSMARIRKRRRYTLLLLGVRYRKALICDDLGEMLIKRLRKMHRLGKQAMDDYHLKHISEAHHLIGILRGIMSLSSGGMSKESIQKLAGEDPEKIIEKCDKFNAHANNNYFHFLPPFYKGIRSVLFQILNVIRLRAARGDRKTETIIRYLLALHKVKSPRIPLSMTVTSNNGFSKTMSLPTDWITDTWKILIFKKKKVSPQDVADRRFLEICAFSHIATELQTGDLYIPGAEHLSDYRDQLISWDDYQEKIKEYSEQAGIPTTAKRFIRDLKNRMEKTAARVDEAFPENEYVSIENGEPCIKRPPRSSVPEGFQVAEEALSGQMKKTNIVEILRESQYWIDWCKPFGPVTGMKSRLSEQLSSYITTAFCYGCGLGPAQTSRSIPGIRPRHLSFIHDRHITEEMLDEANIRVINSYKKFALTRFWGQGKSSSADGTKWNIYEKNLLSEYHIRYGGYGGIGYYHVADNYIAFFSRFIPCGVWEGIYILDGLMQHNSDIDPDTVYSDTQGQNAPIFGLAYLLGINLMPRIRNWKNLTMFRSDSSLKYEHIDELFSETISWRLIEKNLKDMLRVALSVREGKITASTILKKLGTKSRKNQLYYAFRELGRAARTMFLLEYLHSLELRKAIHSGTNKSEAFNGFTKWVSFGKNATIASNDREDQRKSIKFNHLVSNLIILHNADSMTKAINELNAKNIPVSNEVKSALSPYRTEHINRFGIYQLNISEKPKPMQMGLSG